jgi:hypothetical protein
MVELIKEILLLNSRIIIADTNNDVNGIQSFKLEEKLVKCLLLFILLMTMSIISQINEIMANIIPNL